MKKEERYEDVPIEDKGSYTRSDILMAMIPVIVILIVSWRNDVL
jgi:hypothetical protein